MTRPPSYPMCQREGCGQIVTNPLNIAGRGGTSYTIYLCATCRPAFVERLKEWDLAYLCVRKLNEKGSTLGYDPTTHEVFILQLHDDDVIDPDTIQDKDETNQPWVKAWKEATKE